MPEKPTIRKTLCQFLNSFAYGLLGLLVAYGSLAFRTDPSGPGAGPGFGFAFLGMVWIPLGTLSSILLLFVLRGVRPRRTWMSLGSFTGGAAFLGGVLIVAHGELPTELFAVVPPICFVATACLVCRVGVVRESKQL